MSAAVENEGRDYGPAAIKRRLGLLAKERREQMGLGRISFAETAGVGSDSTVQQFEFGQRWPRPQTLRKFEDALGWKYCITEDILFSKQAASSITAEDLDDPAIDRGDGGAKMLRQLTTQQLVAELGRRVERLESRGVPGMGAMSRSEYDLAASDDHVEGEDDRD